MTSKALERRLTVLEERRQPTKIAIDIGDQVYMLPLSELIGLLDSINGADCGLPRPAQGAAGQFMIEGFR